MTDNNTVNEQTTELANGDHGKQAEKIRRLREQLEKLTKKQLVEQAGERELDTSGTKADLVERLLEDARRNRSMAEQLRKARERYEPSVAYSGNKSAHNGDDLAGLLSGSSPEDVIAAAEVVLQLEPGELAAKYDRLNPGQRRMNAGNRIRAAWKRGDCTTEDVARALGS